jgi:hypothetical protein
MPTFRAGGKHATITQNPCVDLYSCIKVLTDSAWRAYSFSWMLNTTLHTNHGWLSAEAMLLATMELNEYCIHISLPDVMLYGMHNL